MMRRWKSLRVLLFAILAATVPLRAADSLKWNSAEDRVEATVQFWTVPEVLQRVAGATGWKIFVDPGITKRVEARFKDKPQGEALRQLLAGCNYALVPETNGPSRLFVFRNSRDEATHGIQPRAETGGKAKKGGICKGSDGRLKTRG